MTPESIPDAFVDAWNDNDADALAGYTPGPAAPDKKNR